MSNMSYCRFINTLGDLKDCYYNFDEPCSEAEEKARYRLLKLCHEIANNYELEDFKPKAPSVPAREEEI